MRPLSARRGFTLSELAVSLAVSAMVLVTVMGAVIAQQRGLQGTEASRGTNEAGRDALVELERTLRRAGFGVDPRHAFDFRHFRCTTADRLPGHGSRPACRDRRDAPDQLVFLARNPAYRVDLNGTNGCADATGCPTGRAWKLVNADPAGGPPSLTLRAFEGQRFERGQVLLAVCPGGYRHTMVTVRDRVDVAADGEVQVALRDADAAVPTFANELAHSCYAAGATVFEIERYAYTVRVLGGTPWLVLDRGLDLDGDGNDPWTTGDDDDVLLVAANVEDLQVAYVLDPASGTVDSDANGVLGDDRTISLPEEPDPAADAPDYRTPPDAPARRTVHPGNVRAVRVSVVLRSPAADPGPGPAWLGDPLPLAENGARVLGAPELGRRRRQLASATVSLRNMGARGMFVF